MKKKEICPCCQQPVKQRLLTLKKKIVEAWWDQNGWVHYDWNDIPESHKDILFAEKIINMVEEYLEKEQADNITEKV